MARASTILSFFSSSWREGSDCHAAFFCVCVEFLGLLPSVVPCDLAEGSFPLLLQKDSRSLLLDGAHMKEGPYSSAVCLDCCLTLSHLVRMKTTCHTIAWAFNEWVDLWDVSCLCAQGCLPTEGAQGSRLCSVLRWWERLVCWWWVGKWIEEVVLERDLPDQGCAVRPTFRYPWRTHAGALQVSAHLELTTQKALASQQGARGGIAAWAQVGYTLLLFLSHRPLKRLLHWSPRAFPFLTQLTALSKDKEHLSLLSGFLQSGFGARQSGGPGLCRLSSSLPFPVFFSRRKLDTLSPQVRTCCFSLKYVCFALTYTYVFALE